MDSLDIQLSDVVLLYDTLHEKTDLKVLVVVMPKEGWARVASPTLQLV